MTKRMLIDASHNEEVRVAIVDGQRLEDYDIETVERLPLKSNIYLAKVMRIEPSLQAAFVEYGGNRHGFLAFSEIHPDYYKIPVGDQKYFSPPPAQASDAVDDYADEGEGLEATSTPDVGFLTGPIVPRAAGEMPVEEGLEQASPMGMESAYLDPFAPVEPVRLSEAHASDEAEGPMLGEALGGALGDPLGETLGENLPEESNTGEQANGPEAREGSGETAGGYESVGGDEMDTRPRRRLLRQYKIQEVIRRGQIMLIQVVKEERGNKGAALTTYLSLAGRYSVLMPNSENGGGVSRKIANIQDRRRMREMLDTLEVPAGMSVILRTSGMDRNKAEIQRDFEYLLRLWDEVREKTLTSSAPALIYAEGDLIQRSLRDIYTPDIDEIHVEGQAGYEKTRNFMQSLMPTHIDRVKLHNDPAFPLFFRYQVETQIDQLHNPVVQLRSGGYIVINQTEALVAIDVNSGRSTRERNIEGTAYRTNLEAAEEIARQLRLRDLAGLIVIDFIDMEDNRNNIAVERRLKDAMRHDRARLQIGRISLFGLLELSRQRLRPSLIEASFEKCSHCSGTGLVRSKTSAAMTVLRAIEEECTKQRSSGMIVYAATPVALTILNSMRASLLGIEQRYGVTIMVEGDESLSGAQHRLERQKGRPGIQHPIAVSQDQIIAASTDLPPLPTDASLENGGGETSRYGAEGGDSRGRRRRGGRGRGRGGRDRQDFRGGDPAFAQGGYGDTASASASAPALRTQDPFAASEQETAAMGGAGNGAPEMASHNLGNRMEDAPQDGEGRGFDRFSDRGGDRRGGDRGGDRQGGRRGGRGRGRGGRGGFGRQDEGERAPAQQGGGNGWGSNRWDTPAATPSSIFDIDTTPRDIDTTPREATREMPRDGFGEPARDNPMNRDGGMRRPTGRDRSSGMERQNRSSRPATAARESAQEFAREPARETAPLSAKPSTTPRHGGIEITMQATASAEPRVKKSSEADVVVTEAGGENKPKAGWWKRMLPS